MRGNDCCDRDKSAIQQPDNKLAETAKKTPPIPEGMVAHANRLVNDGIALV